MQKRIILDLIMANACNKMCEYCCIRFGGQMQSKENIDYLLQYLEKHSDDYKDCVINFFGWEPLLNYKNIVYFIEKNTNPKISYNLGTNGFLLTEESAHFLDINNVKIYLSFHADSTNTYKKLLEKTYLKEYRDLEVNFIVQPKNIEECYQKIDKLIESGFKKINIIPVMLTMKWEMNAIKELNSFIHYVDEKYTNNAESLGIKISKYSFFDGIIQEKTFVVDTSLNIYQDSSDELYIGKQFTHLGSELSQEIETGTYLGNILSDSHTPKDYMEKHSVKEIFRLIYKLPKKMEYVKDYQLIYKIMNRGKQEHKRGSYSIFWANE